MADRLPWYLTHEDGSPTGTTGAIVAIDQQLATTEQLWLSSTCMVCGRNGFHVHEGEVFQ